MWGTNILFLIHGRSPPLPKLIEVFIRTVVRNQVSGG